MMKTYTARTAISHTDVFIPQGKTGITEDKLSGLDIPYLVSRRALVPEGKTARKIDTRTATRDELVRYIEERKEAEREAAAASRIKGDLPEAAFFPLENGTEAKLTHPSRQMPQQRGARAPDFRDIPNDEPAEDAVAVAVAEAGTATGASVADMIREQVAGMEGRLLEVLMKLNEKK